MTSVNINDYCYDDFDAEVLESDLPTLIHFWAAWSGPSKMMDSYIVPIADKYVGRLKVGRLDIDDCPDIAFKYNVKSLPAVLFFKGGAIVGSILSSCSSSTIEQEALKHI